MDSMKGVPGLTKDEIVSFVADMFRAWMLDDDPNLLWYKSMKEYDPEDWANGYDDYYMELASQYLEFTYNRVSYYSDNEHLLYMAGRYSALE